ncbi:hypothetical protein [Sinorhizobium sp. RAC02]|uniref:hypothetical protein n=1 Tax=Sinorhizobium sp. RAC02 TaxID=1842534 RepID=UPI000855AFCF|nr:hypothetical protein [Sinorhizobium sp. RAC02]AOF90541.1 hypothetical protein BSY16_2376 [Sinorhizobium sp. RAC02]
MSALGALPEGLTCRPIMQADWQAVIDCLGRGFPERPRKHWEEALTRMARRRPVGDFPQYGYVLDSAGRIVGVMLTLYFPALGQRDAVRCNLSSWAVDEDFRSYALKLVMTAMRRKEVTYLSITPAPVTLKVTEALRFKRFADGQLAFLPILSSTGKPVQVVEVRPDAPELGLLPQDEQEMLLQHAAMGCRALICIRDGLASPFVFKTRRVLKGLVPCSQVIYCRSHADLSQHAGALGRHLLRKGQLICLVDSNGPVTGLVGRYFAEIGPKYFKGPNPPSPGDLAFTEFVVFGS